MAKAQTQETQINIWALPTQRELIDKASAILNKSRSDFMVEAACREAENVLLDHRLCMVDSDAYQAFEAALDSPISENTKLMELLTKKAPWEK